MKTPTQSINGFMGFSACRSVQTVTHTHPSLDSHSLPNNLSFDSTPPHIEQKGRSCYQSASQSLSLLSLSLLLSAPLLLHPLIYSRPHTSVCHFAIQPTAPWTMQSKPYAFFLIYFCFTTSITPTTLEFQLMFDCLFASSKL